MNNEEKKSQYQKIICPYCFNEMLNPESYNVPFSHEDVAFRSESYYLNETDLLQKAKAEFADKLGAEIESISSPEDIELLEATNSSFKELSNWYKARTKYIVTKDKKYQAFWDLFDGKPTEKSEKIGGKIDQWDLPIISKGNGVKRFIKDDDGFVCGAIDSLGRPTSRRVCPHCHNPLPERFGKNPVRNISVIGTTHCGKTVYISQLLKGMETYLPKAGLSAFPTAGQVSEFIKNNPVKKGTPLPNSTLPKSFSQPVFYDVERVDDNGVVYSDTLVIYDIAGENCEEVSSVKQFTTFIKHSHGLILLVEPEQLGLIPNKDDNIKNINAVLTTLHSILPGHSGRQVEIPVSFCISKADKCFNTLPQAARLDVTPVKNKLNFPLKKFNGMEYNELETSLTQLIDNNANPICVNLRNGYLNSNFFAVSAIGCECVKMDDGTETPASVPNPKRIEEPILWLFKHFGFIGTNANVKRPFPIPQARSYRYVKKLFKPAYLEEIEVEPSYTEEEEIRRYETVVTPKDGIQKMNAEYEKLEKIPLGNNE